MIGAAAAYMSGLFFASFFTKGSDLLLLAGMLPLFYVITRVFKISFGDFALISLFFTTAYAVGILSGLFIQRPLTEYDGSYASYSGKVESIKYYDGAKAQYTLNGKINDSTEAKIIFFGDDCNVLVGDEMTLDSCLLSVPESDYLFKTEGYYTSRKIFLKAEKVSIASIEHNDSQWLKRCIYRYRSKIISEFYDKLGYRNGGFLTGIVLGETSGINDNDKSLMYRCGVGHIMAVSGLHISIAAALLMFILRRLKMGKFMSFALMNIFFVFMMIMTESPISALRAAIMLDFMYSARLFRRQNDSFTSLSSAVLLICLFNPFVIHDAGFLLSVSGTFGIAVFGPYMTQNMKTENVIQRLWKSVAEMFCVMMAILPANIYFFDEASVISPIMNVMLTPLTAAAMVIGIIYVFTGGLISALSLSGIIIDAVLKITDMLGRLGFTHFACRSSKLFWITVLNALFVVASAAIFKSRRLTAVSAACAMTVFITMSVFLRMYDNNQFKVAVLGKGTNASVVILHDGIADVVDMSGYYKASRYVQKYLTANGVSEVRTLCLTAKAPSQYAAYLSSLELFCINNILTDDDICLTDNYDSRVVNFNDNGFDIKNDDYTLSYDKNILNIKCKEISVSILKTREERPENDDIAVYYGNITDKSDIDFEYKNIYLDKVEGISYEYSDINNFEIILSPANGEFYLRRL